jgi:hypothetical protein
VTTYVLSIEPTEGTSFRHGLGADDLAVAKQMASAMFDAYKTTSAPIRTIAIFEDGPHGGTMVDVFDGTWTSESMADFWADDEEPV